MTAPLLAHVGAFSMSNYGDRLYPPLLAHLLRADGCSIPVQHFAVIPGHLDDGEPVATLDRVAPSNPTAVLVGGGDLVRTDGMTIAMDHLCVPTELRRSPVARVRARRFARRRFPVGAGPWIPSAGWVTGDVPILLASVGVHDLPDRPDVRAGLAHVDEAWVRTPAARDRLVGSGVPAARVVVAPDAIFALRDVAPSEPTIAHGRELLRDVTGSAEPVVVVHAAPFAGWGARRIAMLLDALRGLHAVTLPLGGYAGEDRMLRAGARAAGRTDLGLMATADTTAVLAAAGCLVTTSLHAAIVAACYGTPVLVPDVEKIRSGLDACPEPPPIHLLTAGEVPTAAAGLAGLRESPSAEANADTARRAFTRTLRRAGVGG